MATELNRQAAGPDLALGSNNDDVRSKFPKQSWERRLSAVEGFDPKQYARTIQDANGQESLYLDVQYRKMWFRLCNPTGKIVKKICTFDGNLAVVEARIYLDRNDAPENFVSNAFAQRFVDPNNPEYGTRYLESAETAAVGRALADAGYGLQFCMEPDPTPVDMGQTPFAMASDAFDDPEPFTPVPTGVNGNYPINTAAQSNRPAPQPVQQQQYQPPQSQPQNVQQYNANRYHAPVQPQAPTFTHQTPVDEIVRLMPYEEAVKVVYRCNGKHNGKTLGQIAVEDIRSIEWIANSYNGDKNLFKGAAKVILNRHTGGQ